MFNRKVDMKSFDTTLDVVALKAKPEEIVELHKIGFNAIFLGHALDAMAQVHPNGLSPVTDGRTWDRIVRKLDCADAQLSLEEGEFEFIKSLFINSTVKVKPQYVAVVLQYIGKIETLMVGK